MQLQTSFVISCLYPVFNPIRFDCVNGGGERNVEPTVLTVAVVQKLTGPIQLGNAHWWKKASKFNAAERFYCFYCGQQIGFFSSPFLFTFAAIQSSTNHADATCVSRYLPLYDALLSYDQTP